MSNKKNGYAYLKERTAQLEAENKRLAEEVKKDVTVYNEQQKKIAILEEELKGERVAHADCVNDYRGKIAELEKKANAYFDSSSKERDMWKRHYEAKIDEMTAVMVQRDFLLYHANFFLRRKYQRYFND